MKLVLVLFVVSVAIYEVSGASLHWRRNSGSHQFFGPPQFVGPPQWNPYIHPRPFHHGGQPPEWNESTTESDDWVTESSSVSSSEPSTASSSEASSAASSEASTELSSEASTASSSEASTPAS